MVFVVKGRGQGPSVLTELDAGPWTITDLSLLTCETGIRTLPTSQRYCGRKGLGAGPAWRVAFAPCFIFSPFYWLLSPLGQSESQQEREWPLQGFKEDSVTKGLCVALQSCGHGRRNVLGQQEPEALAHAEGQLGVCPPIPGESHGHGAGQGTRHRQSVLRS